MILNEFQEEAANHVDGPCLVTACPGSGKTATLVERTIRLLKRGINPKNILCITFTNKAAKEMKERISKAMDNQSLGLYAGTFHALCVKILRKLGKYNGYSSNFIILDAQDQKDLISQIAKNEGIELEKKHIGYIAKSVNDYRDKLAPYSFLEEQLYGDQLEVAVKYLKSLKKNNIIDFSGLIYETIKLLENNENVKEAIQENFKYLQVDEVQDTNYSQFYLLNLFSEKWKNITMVGDLNQSIYRFRNARYQNILDFIDKYSDCKIINLSYNYRSTPEIVKHAYSLIKHNENNMIKSFETQNPSGDPVRCMDYEDQYHEAYSIAQKIQNLIKNENWEYNDFAILYRMNSMSEPLEQAFVKYGIPYEVIGSRSFYDRKEIRDCMAMLKFLVNRMDKISFYRLSSLIKGMGGATVKKIEKVSEENDIDILEAARKLKYNTNSKRVKDSCIFLCDIYDEIDVDSGNPALCLSQLTEKFKYNKYLDKNFNKEQYETKKENVEQLIISAGNISASVEGIDGYLQNIALMSSSDKETKEGKVSLMTLHASKGLEFPIVFLIGVETGILPHNMSMIEDKEEGICEERRLAFVGISRAERKLFLSYCSYRKKWKNRQFAPFKSYPSQFLYEAGLLEEEEE